MRLEMRNAYNRIQMKDAVITVRVARPTRRRLEALARREGRSLSQQVERLLVRGLDQEDGVVEEQVRPLSGILMREPSTEYGEFRAVRSVLSASLLPVGPGRGPRRR